MENDDEREIYEDMLKLIRPIGKNTMQLIAMCYILAKHANLGGGKEEFDKMAAAVTLSAITMANGGDD